MYAIMSNAEYAFTQQDGSLYSRFYILADIN